MDIIIASAGSITCLFYLFVILFTRPIEKRNYILLAFLMSLTLSLIPVLIPQFHVRPPLWINASFGLLWGPLLYFYILSLITEKVKYQHLFIHCIPFLIFYILTVFFQFNILPVPPNNEIPPHPQGEGSILLYGIIQCASLLGYSIVTLLILHKHNKNIKHHFSYENTHITIRWSYLIILFFVSSYLLVFISQSIFPLHIGAMPFDLHLFLITVFIYILSYFGVKQKPVYLSTLDTTIEEVKEVINSNSKPKYSKNALDEELKKEYQRKLVMYLIDEKPYLRANLSIGNLTDKLNIPKHFISQIINDSLNHTFYSLINSYRVAEAKERIKADQDCRLTLLAIAFDSGFNSKSGFNRNFKQETGMTPLEYRNKAKRLY